MEARDIDGSRVEAILPGYMMLDPEVRRYSAALDGVLKRISPYQPGGSVSAAIADMDDYERAKAATLVSRSVTKARELIEEIEELRRFIERSSINTLRRWGLHEGCPIPRNYSHDGNQILFGKSEYENVSVAISDTLRTHIGRIDFWTEMEKTS
jgi:hypothetical protein